MNPTVPGRKDFMLGVATGLASLSPAERELMRAAGLGWLRCGNLRFDVAAFVRGEEQGAAFAESKARIRELRAEGFQLMGITPGPRELKELAGTPGGELFFKNYRKICRFLAEEFRGLIEWWQVANELDIWIFRESLTMEESARFLKEGILGIKEAGREFKVGINITLYPSLPGEVDGNTEAHEGVYLARQIYGDPALETDYAGFDSYPGTWRKGGVESWDEYLEGFHRLTGKPIIIQEFGYASAGEMMTPEEERSGVYPCQAKKWRFSWEGRHDRETQARFLGKSLEIFAGKAFVLGATYYCWKDAARCWQCKEADCPAETAWGLLDQEGNPKASYFACVQAARTLFAVPERNEVLQGV